MAAGGCVSAGIEAGRFVTTAGWRIVALGWAEAADPLVVRVAVVATAAPEPLASAPFPPCADAQFRGSKLAVREMG